jgi:putative DNA primase/helicase
MTNVKMPAGKAGTVENYTEIITPNIQFINAMRDAGIEPPSTIIADGTIHRFNSNGKAGNKNSWYVYYADNIHAGSFGDWQKDISQTWRADIGRTLNLKENAEHNARIAAMRVQRETEEVKTKAEAKQRANEIWNKATLALSHNYLTRKGIKAYDIKVNQGTLVIPLCADDGDIHSLQFINADGGKMFLSGGHIKGCYFSIGKPQDVIYICEGYATGASIYEATGTAIAVAFNAGNLLSVAQAIRAKYQAIKIVICADNDSSQIGMNKAKEAAITVSGYVVMPDFGKSRPENLTDFNDLHQLNGLAEVKRQLDAQNAPLSDYLATGGMLLLPEPLPSMPSVLPFDYDYLPDGLRGFVQDISERMQCPPDFAAVGVMVMMSAIIGRKVGMRPMQYNDWTVIPNLWGAVVGNSGVMKSPTLSASLSPIKKLQVTAYEVFKKAIAESQMQSEVAKMQETINKNKAKALLKKDQSANVKNLLQSNIADEAPILKRYITNNASYEALGELLIENPNGLMIEADEIIGLLKQLDASGQEVARSFYLTAADGDKPYTFDRIMRGKGLHIPALCICIIGGIQPGVLAEYVRQATNGGAGADGLLQRFALMVYPDISPNWKEVDRYPDKTAKKDVNQLAEWLDNLDPLNDIKTELDEYGNVPYMRFDNDAQLLFSEWRESLEIRLRSGEEHPSMVSHLSKYRKLIPSLALINHLCEDGKDAITEKSLLRAIAYSEYLESHARRIYASATRPDIDAARTIINKLQKSRLSNPFTARDVYRNNWTGLDSKQKTQSAIDLLIEYNHLIVENIETGGRPTAFYHWNSGVKS